MSLLREKSVFQHYFKSFAQRKRFMGVNMFSIVAMVYPEGGLMETVFRSLVVYNYKRKKDWRNNSLNSLIKFGNKIIFLQQLYS
jgi:hypothetical protein